MKNTNRQRNRAPRDSGLYFLHDSDYSVVYVGISESYHERSGIRSRPQLHHNPPSANENQRVPFSYFSYALITDELIRPLEKFLIGVLNPVYNKNHRTILP